MTTCHTRARAGLHSSRNAVLLIAPVFALAACRSRPTIAPHPLAIAPSVADSVRSERIANGVMLHTIVNVKVPWRAVVLDVDLRCNALQAVKGAPTAVGRLTTTQLLASLPGAVQPIAAVNADFFLFVPPGVPTNAHIERGEFLSGPDARPVFWRGANGAVGFDSLRVSGTLRSTSTTLALTAWNRPAARTSGVVDAKWGAPLDTIVRRRFWRLDPIRSDRRGTSLSGRYVIRAARPADTLVRGDTLLLHLAPREQPPADGTELTLEVRVTGRGVDAARTTLAEVVGGRPMLVADSVAARDVDTDGAESFRGPNPRTLMGLDRAGRRAMIAVVDGRQPGYSMGMTLRQEADLMLALGMTRALNLDGGGSSAMVLRDGTGRTRTVNKPSDAVGERAVANALAVVGTCR